MKNADSPAMPIGEQMDAMRYTETKLDKIVRIGMARIDQVFDKCCDDLDKLKPVDQPVALGLSGAVGRGLLDLQALGIHRLGESARLQRQLLNGFGSMAAQAGRLGQGYSPLGSLLVDANSGRQGA